MINEQAMAIMADAMNTENVYREMANGDTERAEMYTALADREMNKLEAMAQMAAALTGLTMQEVIEAVCDVVYA